MIKAVIFDFGGVIMRTEDYGPRRAWDERLNLEPGTVERAVHGSDLWVQAQLGRITADRYWRGVAELVYMRDLSQIDQLRADYFSGDYLNHRVISVIHDLRAHGCTTAILTNESLELTNRLENIGVAHLFDQVFISAQLGVMKPDPTIYRLALQRLGAPTAETVFIDDMLINVRGAQALGLNTILYRSETDLRSELKPYFDDGVL